MTRSQVLKTSSLPQAEAETLLAFFLKTNREAILTHPEKEVSSVVKKKFAVAEKKRLANWPLAYLIGQKGFYGRDFLVSPAVLVPRPETELLVEEILKISREKERPLIIDLGTGSGAIIVSLAAELKRLFPKQFPKMEFMAGDISPSALRLAKTNARRHKLEKKIRFLAGDLLMPIMTHLKNRELIIAANLPYLTPTQIKSSPTISREPRLALDGGSDGLKYYRRLFGQLKQASFRTATLFCEIDPSQAKEITFLSRQYWSKARIEIKKDLSGRKRLAIIELNNGLN